MWMFTGIGWTLGLLLASTAQAADPITIEKLQTNASSYHVKTVTLQGTVHQVQVLTDAPVALPQLDFQCQMIHPPYTFVLTDDTGFLQITVRARLPCVTKRSPVEPPDVAEGDTVTVDAQVTVGPDNTVNALALGIRRN